MLRSSWLHLAGVFPFSESEVLMKRSLLIALGLLAGLSSMPAFAANPSAANSTVANSKPQADLAKKSAVAECKKEGLIGKKLDACVKNKTESK
jgi:hypothetical protein